MGKDYSLWSSSLTPGPSRRTDNEAFGVRYGFNYLPRDFPTWKAERIAQENIALLNEIADTSQYDAFSVWRGSVSGLTWFKGDKEAAVKAGAKDQPNWNYKKQYLSLGLSPLQAEDLGNYNYGSTGYELLMNILTNMGLGESSADSITRPILRVMGGVYQLRQDGVKRFMQVDHTWYGEEVKDVSSIEAGMDYGQFRRLSKLAEKSGVRLSPEDFGFSKQPDPALRLLELDLSQEVHVKELQQEFEATIRRVNEEVRAERMRAEAERMRGAAELEEERLEEERLEEERLKDGPKLLP